MTSFVITNVGVKSHNESLWSRFAVRAAGESVWLQLGVGLNHLVCAALRALCSRGRLAHQVKTSGQTFISAGHVIK